MRKSYPWLWDLGIRGAKAVLYVTHAVLLPLHQNLLPRFNTVKP